MKGIAAAITSDPAGAVDVYLRGISTDFACHEARPVDKPRFQPLSVSEAGGATQNRLCVSPRVVRRWLRVAAGSDPIFVSIPPAFLTFWCSLFPDIWGVLEYVPLLANSLLLAAALGHRPNPHVWPRPRAVAAWIKLRSWVRPGVEAYFKGAAVES